MILSSLVNRLQEFSIFQETERLREAAVKFLNSALCKDQTSSAGTVGLSEGLEAEIFLQSKNLVNNLSKVNQIKI